MVGRHKKNARASGEANVVDAAGGKKKGTGPWPVLYACLGEKKKGGTGKGVTWEREGKRGREKKTFPGKGGEEGFLLVPDARTSQARKTSEGNKGGETSGKKRRNAFPLPNRGGEKPTKRTFLTQHGRKFHKEHQRKKKEKDPSTGKNGGKKRRSSVNPRSGEKFARRKGEHAADYVQKKKKGKKEKTHSSGRPDKKKEKSRHLQLRKRNQADKEKMCRFTLDQKRDHQKKLSPPEERKPLTRPA